MQLADLTMADLKAHVVWEYQGESDADACVKPTDRLSLGEYEEGTFLAATEFMLADGSSWTGYCSPQDPSGLDYTQPVLFVDGQQVPLWLDQGQDKAAIERRWQALGRTLEQVFPVKYKCVIKVDGQEVCGLVHIDDTISAGGAV